MRPQARRSLKAAEKRARELMGSLHTAETIIGRDPQMLLDDSQYKRINELAIESMRFFERIGSLVGEIEREERRA